MLFLNEHLVFDKHLIEKIGWNDPFFLEIPKYWKKHAEFTHFHTEIQSRYLDGGYSQN